MDDNVLHKYDRFIHKICMHWVASFKHDRSLDIDDLIQEARIKVLMNFDKSYDENRGSQMAYIGYIIRNLFISKYNVMKNKNMFIPETDLNKRDEFGLTVFDKLMDKEFLPDQEMESEELLLLVKKQLRLIQYNPNNFVRRIRSFTEVVFDYSLLPDEKLMAELLFDLRCKQRLAKKYNKKIPNKAKLTASFLAKKIGVDIRSVNKAMILIKQTIHECVVLSRKGNKDEEKKNQKNKNKRRN